MSDDGEAVARGVVGRERVSESSFDANATDQEECNSATKNDQKLLRVATCTWMATINKQIEMLLNDQ